MIHSGRNKRCHAFPPSAKVIRRLQPPCKRCQGAQLAVRTFDDFENFECQQCGVCSGCRPIGNQHIRRDSFEFSRRRENLTFSHQSARNAKSVCDTFEFSRRRENLTFTHQTAANAKSVCDAFEFSLRRERGQSDFDTLRTTNGTGRTSGAH
jgi:hypothetical protein